MNNPYEVLGLAPDSEFEQLRIRYNYLKAKYSEDRFLAGEAGNEAARRLTELETAWQIISDNKTRSDNKQEFGGDYGAIDNLIKAGKYDEAQAALDSIASRTGEWHYFQSIIYYKRDWLSESRMQLQMAVNLEPWNDKYKTALNKLDMVIGNPGTNPNNLGRDSGQPNPPPVRDDGAVCANNCANCCLAYLITDCCCTMCQMCG